eukprot:TRINITY_DN1289_c0_g2_i3.p1 TRINITY_DN1289_c0_g2~~TRINITY_DN1289_c0_g2_i3.p1  ORF type:complete len:177 (+),score=24.59 TRINITY_DN1289_c0_g2_i3:242-772(+)
MPVVVIASSNPVKVEAVTDGFEQVFPGTDFVFKQVIVASGVGDQPMDDLETLKGACNRVNNAQELHPDADFWVAVEAGVECREDDFFSFGWTVIRSKEKEGSARTATFMLPKQVSNLLLMGKELGEADDIVFGQTKSKHKNGAVGLLTADHIVRKTLISPSVILALIPFINTHLDF